MTLHYSTYNITNLAVMHTEKFCAHKPVLAGTTKHACGDPTLQYLYYKFPVQLSFEPAFHKREFFVDHTTMGSLI